RSRALRDRAQEQRPVAFRAAPRHRGGALGSRELTRKAVRTKDGQGRNELEGGLSKSIKAASFIPRSRPEALTDGLFPLAMTLLVVNIELPEGFHPKTNEELLSGLANLTDTFIAYLITFFVLVSFWFGRSKEDGEPEMASADYAWAVLIHLVSVTSLPFSLLAVGRYDVPAAAWVYGANMILFALSPLAISLCAERDTGRA